jgi:hypothetical protein
MSIYFEGNGKPRPVTVGEARDQFVYALKEMRDEALQDPYLDAYEDSAARDTAVANKIIGGVLGILDGNSEHFPAVNLIAYDPPEDKEEAIAAGANYIDHREFADFGQGLEAYWALVNS